MPGEGDARWVSCTQLACTLQHHAERHAEQVGNSPLSTFLYILSYSFLPSSSASTHFLNVACRCRYSTCTFSGRCSATCTMQGVGGRGLDHQ